MQISYIGMRTQEVEIKPTLKVVLKSDSQNLDEVVVTAMGIKRSEKSLGYAVSSVKGDEITKARESNVLNSLSGKIAGLQIAQSSGTVGQVYRFVALLPLVQFLLLCLLLTDFLLIMVLTILTEPMV